MAGTRTDRYLIIHCVRVQCIAGSDELFRTPQPIQAFYAVFAYILHAFQSVEMFACALNESIINYWPVGIIGNASDSSRATAYPDAGRDSHASTHTPCANNMFPSSACCAPQQQTTHTTHPTNVMIVCVDVDGGAAATTRKQQVFSLGLSVVALSNLAQLRHTNCVCRSTT